MAIDYKSLNKLETVPVSRQAVAADGARRVAIVLKLRPGTAMPSYVTKRSEIGDGIITGEIVARDLERLEADPAVESVSLSRPLSLIS